MNILIIPSWYHTQTNPTLGSFFKEQAEALAEVGHDVTLLYVDRYGIKYLKRYLQYKEKTNYIENGVTIYRKKKLRKIKSRSIGDCNTFTDGVLELYKKYIHNNKRIDVIHAHSCLWAGYAAMKLKEKYNIPYIITEHFTGYSRNLIIQEEIPLIKDEIKHADKVISVSEGLKQDLAPYSNNKTIKVIPNMVDIKKFQLIKNTVNDGKFRFLSVCYLMHKKGLDILLKAFAEVFKGNEKVELFIGGDGEEKNNLISLTKVLKIENQVKFLGDLNREEVIENMQNCDAFVLPSRFETFGVVFIEALACGKPIIATKTGGPDSIVNEKNGFLVDVEDIEGLSIAMKKIVSNISCYDAELIRNDCVNRFSEKAVIEQLEQVYKDILKKR